MEKSRWWLHTLYVYSWHFTSLTHCNFIEVVQYSNWIWIKVFIFIRNKNPICRFRKLMTHGDSLIELRVDNRQSSTTPPRSNCLNAKAANYDWVERLYPFAQINTTNRFNIICSFYFDFWRNICHVACLQQLSILYDMLLYWRHGGILGCPKGFGVSFFLHNYPLTKNISKMSQFISELHSG